MSSYPRVLVISNNCFSKTGSNGRTLGNLFLHWDSEKIAQFYIHNEYPNHKKCSRYYRITDKEILQSILSRKAGKVISEKNEDILKSNLSSKSIKNKTVIKYLLRNVIWKVGNWYNVQFKKWIKQFDPELIVFQAGDTPFMYKIARTISNDYKIPLVIFNTEGYYFKNYNYIEEKNKMDLLYSIFHKNLKKEFEETMKITQLTVYNCEELLEEYNRYFDNKGIVIMNASDFTKEKVENIRYKKNTFAYLGNLGLERYKSLIEISKCIASINSDFFIEVYGKANTEIKNALDNIKSIRYQGIIDYTDVQRKILESEYLIHIESFSDFYKDDLKFAFSTKIADYVASGRSIICYAPKNVACFKYLRKYRLGCTIDEDDDPYIKLNEYLNSGHDKELFNLNSKKMAKQNHDLETNINIFENELIRVVSSSNESTSDKLRI